MLFFVTISRTFIHLKLCRNIGLKSYAFTCFNVALFEILLAVPLQDSYIQSRADTMQNIESTIVELGSIFQQLAHMVKEQEETIQR